MENYFWFGNTIVLIFLVIFLILKESGRKLPTMRILWAISQEQSLNFKTFRHDTKKKKICSIVTFITESCIFCQQWFEFSRVSSINSSSVNIMLLLKFLFTDVTKNVKRVTIFKKVFVTLKILLGKNNRWAMKGRGWVCGRPTPQNSPLWRGMENCN